MGFRRDVELAPGPGFRLRRRLWPRVLSGTGLVAGVALGVLDFKLGYHGAGLLLFSLSFAFLVQLVMAEVDSWRFEGAEAVRRRLVLRELVVRETRVAAKDIAGVQVEFVGKRARAWIETVGGEELPLVEGDEKQVREIADRLSEFVRVALEQPPRSQLH